MGGQGREQFRQIILAEAEPLGHAAPDEILEPLHDLVGAITESGVGAELVDGPGGRVTLTLWPPHRRSHRTLMLPFVRGQGEVVALLSGGRRSFRTADDLRAFLTEFVSRPEFKAGLAYLREQAQEPVEAVLRSPDQTVMVGVAAADQQRLDEAGPAQEVELPVTLEEGEALPHG